MACLQFIHTCVWVSILLLYVFHPCLLVGGGGGKRTIYIFCALHFDYISFVVGQYTRIFSGAYLHFPIHRCFTNKQDDEVQEKEEAQQRELTGGGNFMFSLDFFCTIIIAVFPLYFPPHPFKFGFYCFFHHIKIIVFLFFYYYIFLMFILFIKNTQKNCTAPLGCQRHCRSFCHLSSSVGRFVVIIITSTKMTNVHFKVALHTDCILWKRQKKPKGRENYFISMCVSCCAVFFLCVL